MNLVDVPLRPQTQSRHGCRGMARKKHHEEEHVNHERWLVSYADMMTLLMVLFIVMFAISAVDQRKFAALKDGLTSGFGATATAPVSGGQGLIDNDGVVPAPLDLSVGMGASTKSRGETPGEGTTEQVTSTRT